MNLNRLFLPLVFISFLSCGQSNKSKKIVVIENQLDVDRAFETVELTKSMLGIKPSEMLEQFGIKEVGSENVLVSQHIDSDGDGNSDVILFQPIVGGGSSVSFELVKIEGKEVTDGDPDCSRKNRRLCLGKQ